MLHLFYHY